MMQSWADYLFLSHLCGGEVLYAASQLANDFLSHLCGGEVLPSGVSLQSSFLSHLCGGEEVMQFMMTSK